MKVEIGDVLISRERHSCEVKFVEDVNEEGILLVDGVQDEYYGIEVFYNKIMEDKYEMMCKKEDRKDLI